MLLSILGVLITVALGILGLTAVSNFLFFPRLKASQPVAQPKLSILIPARNEAAVIGSTVRALLAQNYHHFELILLDDQSEDGTGAIATEAAKGDARFRLLSGTPLPPGWLGKNWACHQLSQAATGEYLLFADADVRWAPEALAALLSLAQTEQADLLTVWPTQQTESHSTNPEHLTPTGAAKPPSADTSGGGRVPTIAASGASALKIPTAIWSVHGTMPCC